MKTSHLIRFFFIGYILAFVSCTSVMMENRAGINPKDFQQSVDGKLVNLWKLENANGVEMLVTNYGVKVVSLLVPDKNGEFVDVVTGFKTLDEFIKYETYFGAVIGRYANRIAKGEFTLDGVEYKLAINNGENHLHGGLKGFNAVVWDCRKLNDNTLEFHYLSKDMEEGYPGNLEVSMIYQLTDKNEFKISYKASTDKKTVVNLTHHSFFNLSGDGSGSINDHVLMLNADYFIPTNDALIPTGEIRLLENTPMDFRTPMPIGSRIDEDYDALKLGKGYDHTYVIRGEGMRLHAAVYSSKTGIEMRVFSDQPGVQFYGGNFFDGSVKGKTGNVYGFREAFALETGLYPDSPNQENFPSPVLEPGEVYKHECVYVFFVKNAK